MAARMPFGEVMRMTLLGNRERMSADRAYEIGLRVRGRRRRRAGRPRRRTRRRDRGGPDRGRASDRAQFVAARRSALDVAPLVYLAGASGAAIEAGQSQFASGQRVEPWIR